MFIKVFESLNDRESNNKEIREYRNFQGHSIIFDKHYFFINNVEDMVWKDQQSLVFPTDVD